MPCESGLGERLRELRIRKGLSQGALAGTLRVSRETVRNWESGRCEPSCAALAELTKLYHVSSDLLLGLPEAKVLRLDHLTDEQAEVISLLVSIIEARAMKTAAS